ncbi:hypothetical protein MKX07_000605 [Trichoderma sp. CBMAI-0711]|nr:hypothetical protein MKX07_000605 [Trichoderma sp. CBMAI-0711]
MDSPWFSPRSTADRSGYAGEESLPANTSPDYALSTQDFSTLSTGWQLDDFVLDPGYVASREELRWLMLNTAQTAPSSPAHVDSFASEADQQGGETLSSAQHQTSHLLSQGRRVEYFKNYISQVAPWLSCLRDASPSASTNISTSPLRNPSHLSAANGAQGSLQWNADTPKELR